MGRRPQISVSRHCRFVVSRSDVAAADPAIGSLGTPDRLRQPLGTPILLGTRASKSSASALLVPLALCLLGIGGPLAHTTRDRCRQVGVTRMPGEPAGVKVFVHILVLVHR